MNLLWLLHQDHTSEDDEEAAFSPTTEQVLSQQKLSSDTAEESSTDSYIPLLAKILQVAQLKAMQVCKKLDEKPTPLGKLNMRRNVTGPCWRADQK
ncbi:hypothetical protein Q9966_002724 [Columba livia]|nr:hypothetical protein Q9966_002724 [Columba livia]